MTRLLPPIRRIVQGDKFLRFSWIGALGCLVGAIVGEIALAVFGALEPRTSNQAVCLLIDCSGSMTVGGGSGPTKLAEVKEAATRFTQRQDLSSQQIGVIGFGSGVHRGVELTGDAAALAAAIQKLYDGGQTAMGEGLEAAAALLEGSHQSAASRPAGRNILLFTDGMPTNRQSALAAAAHARERGIRIVAIATGDADVDYLTQVTQDPSLVFPVAAGDFERGFRDAERTIYGAMMKSSATAAGWLGNVVQAGVWSALLAIGISLGLIVGQNRYAHRRPIARREAWIAILGGPCAGALAGAVGQTFFAFATFSFGPSAQSAIWIWTLGAMGRIVSWAILGGLVAAGLAMFVPNLPAGRAWIGGSIGGAVGAIAFLIVSLAGDAAGRLLGAIILGGAVGMMIALVEAVFRSAWLEIRYGAKETIRVNLGVTPVTIGSAASCSVYVPQARALALQYVFRDAQVTCLDYSTETTITAAPDEERTLGNATITVRTSQSEVEKPAAPGDGTTGGTGPKAPPPPPKAKGRPLVEPMPLERAEGASSTPLPPPPAPSPKPADVSTARPPQPSPTPRLAPPPPPRKKHDTP